jgi:hypothetical protein
MWDNPELLSRLSRWVPYLFIATGFIVAMSGEWVRARVDSRVEVLKEKEANRRKRIPPSLDAYLATSQETGDLLVVMDGKNTTPFLASWLVVTKGDRVISGIMTNDVEIHPAEDRKRFTWKADLKSDLVVDEFVELRLRYVSLYAAELGNPPELSGEIRRAFRLAGGKVQHWAPAVSAPDSP